MAAPVKLDKYQILIAPDSQKVQGLQTGDIVRRQYFDGNNAIYSLMCVLAYGTTKRMATEAQYDSDNQPVFNADGTIATIEVERDVPYFIGALLEGDAPKTKELLDFARITNLFDTDRSGALYLTASDYHAPFMDVIDGIGRNKSLCWPENIASEAFEDPHSQYIVKGIGLHRQFKRHENGNSRIVRLTRTQESTGFCGLSQDFYELVAAQKRVLISYKARAYKPVTVKAEIAYSVGNTKDAEWTEDFSKDWKYYFQAVNVINSGRHLRTFKLDVGSLGVGDWVEIADFNIILLDSVSNYGDATSMRLGKLEGISDPVFGQMTGYGAYIQKLYASQTAHISGTLTAGDENGFASTFYAGKIHRNCFINSCDVNFLSSIAIDDETLFNPTGMGHVYKTSSSDELTMVAQTRAWLDEHQGKRYCFSFWGYAKKPCQIGMKQNGKLIGSIQIGSDQTHEWRRLHVFFDLIQPDIANEDMKMGLVPSFSDSIYQTSAGADGLDEQVLFITAPQLEAGEYCTQYQPTDDILNETDDYGAWFARGGIGGTIQNPLLRLNYDGTGAIDTRTNSFRLNQDGSGWLAKKNIQWDSDGKVTFGKDVTLNWDNLGKDVQDEMAARSVHIVGQNAFSIIGQNDAETTICQPESILMTLTEVGFKSTSSMRQWYLLVGNDWVPIPDANGPSLEVLPDSCYWFGRVHDVSDVKDNIFESKSQISIKCIVKYNETRSYSDTFNVSKQYLQGYVVKITSSKGVLFQNGICSTVLTANVYYNGQLLDTDYVLDNFTFTWHHYKVDDLTTDVGFDDKDLTDGANVITLNYEMDGTDVFVCELGFCDHFDYSFPIIF